MGALEAPQDKHGQEHRTGTSRAEQTTEAMAELGALEAMAVQGALEAMAGHFRGLGLGPLGPAPTAGTLSTPPQKKFPWGIKGVSGALRGWTDTGTGQDTLEQDSPQEQEALLGWLGG